MKTKKLNVQQLKTLIENIAQDVRKELKTEQAKKSAVRKKLEEKMTLGKMGARHGLAGGGKMSFDEWEAGAPTSSEDVVYHMRQTHEGEYKNEMEWAKLYNQYENAMKDAQF